MTSRNLPADTTIDNITIETVLDAIADRVVQRLRADAAAAPRWYTRHLLPPGVRTWRAARETAARLGVPTSKPGREVLIDAAAFDAAIVAPRHSAPTLKPSDEAALEALGVVLPMRARGRR